MDVKATGESENIKVLIMCFVSEMSGLPSTFKGVAPASTLDVGIEDSQARSAVASE